MGALSKIRKAGFSVSLTGDCFEIVPASALTPNQREFLKQHRAEIIIELRAETSGLSACDREKLLDYMAAIGESDKDVIGEYLTECESYPEILARQLQYADDCIQIKTGGYTGLVQCSGCKQLNGDTCQFHGWRVVVDKWRRCVEYATAPKVITCKSCRHFQSCNNHGGGAGSCSAGVFNPSGFAGGLTPFTNVTTGAE